jgi:hypothetical protein
MCEVLLSYYDTTGVLFVDHLESVLDRETIQIFKSVEKNRETALDFQFWRLSTQHRLTTQTTSLFYVNLNSSIIPIYIDHTALQQPYSSIASPEKL